MGMWDAIKEYLAKKGNQYEGADSGINMNPADAAIRAPGAEPALPDAPAALPQVPDVPADMPMRSEPTLKLPERMPMPDFMAGVTEPTDRNAQINAYLEKERGRRVLPNLAAGVADAFSQAAGLEGGLRKELTARNDAQLGDSIQRGAAAVYDDPNSNESKMYQNSAALFLGKKPEEFAKFSANQIKQVLPTIEKFVSKQDDIDAKREAMVASAQARTDKNNDRQDAQILRYTEALEKNPQLQAARTKGIALENVKKMIEQVKQGNTVASAAMGVQMAKAMGEVGVLTENDIKRYVQSGKLSQSAGDKLTRWASGTPTAATLQEIQQIVGTLSDRYNSTFQPIYDTYVNRLSANMGISKEEAARRLDIPYSGMVQQRPAPGGAPAPAARPAAGGGKPANDPMGLF